MYWLKLSLMYDRLPSVYGSVSVKVSLKGQFANVATCDAHSRGQGVVLIVCFKVMFIGTNKLG